MKNNPVAIFTGLAVATAVGLGAIIYSRQPGPEANKTAQPAVSEPAAPEKPADVTAGKKPEASPPQLEQQSATNEQPAPEAAPAPQTTTPEEAKAPETQPSATEAPKPAESQAKTEDPAKPTFDTVRVEPEGDTLAAGQATPGAEVTLKRNGEVVGKAEANADGDWVVTTDAPLPKGASELSVEQKSSDSSPVVVSDQSIAVVVPETPTQKAMVALVEPGMPTQVLQKAEPVASNEPAPVKPEATADASSGTQASDQAAAGQQPAVDSATSTEGTQANATVEQPASEAAKAAPEPAPAAPETTNAGETPAPAETAPETKTALADPSSEPAKVEEPATQQLPAEQPAAETPAAETPAAKPRAPVTLDAVDYNSAGDIVFSGSAGPDSAVRIYVDNQPVGDAVADSAGRWNFAGTQKVAPGGHSLRVDQIDSQGKVISRVELPFVREDAARVAEIMAPEPTAQPEPQKTVEEAQPAPTAPETTAKSEPEATKPTTSETSESAAASVDTTIAPKPEAAPQTAEAGTDVVKTEEGTEVAKTETPAAASSEQPAAKTEEPVTQAKQPAAKAEEPSAQTEQPAASTEQPATKTEEPAVAAADQPATKTEGPAVAAAEQPAAKTEEPAIAAAEQPAAKTEEPAIAAAEQAAAKTEEPAIAAVEAPAAQPESTEPAQIESESSATAGATATQQATQQNEQTQPKKGRVIIQPGNNLWKLSRVIYGKGISYTVIFEANKGQIRDPDLIYPGQIFATPNAVPPESIDPKRRKPLSAEEGGTAVQ